MPFVRMLKNFGVDAYDYIRPYLPVSGVITGCLYLSWVGTNAHEKQNATNTLATIASDPEGTANQVLKLAQGRVYSSNVTADLNSSVTALGARHLEGYKPEGTDWVQNYKAIEANVLTHGGDNALRENFAQLNQATLARLTSEPYKVQYTPPANALRDLPCKPTVEQARLVR